MEAFGAFLDEEWESLSKMFSFEDSDFNQHCENTLDNNNVFSNDSTLLGENISEMNENLFFQCDAINTNNFYCASQESSNSSGFFESGPLMGRADDEAHLQAANNNVVNFFYHDEKTNTFDEAMGFCAHVDSKIIDEGLTMAPVFSDDVMAEILQLKAEMWKEKLVTAGNQTAENGDSSCMEMQLKRKYDHDVAEIHAHDDNLSEIPKKKTRVTREANKNKKSTQSKRSKKAVQISNDEEMNNGGANGQSSSPCSSEEDDCNELNKGSPSDSKVSASNGKSKANKGPATDPQSLYARKRRERINERLRILQNLVPNGTKVDISTMLEEAVHYVKFLQLQIKLLSSDEMWMYAPIAYNGMDMGLYHKIVPNL